MEDHQTSIFEDPAPEPRSTLEALDECLVVLKRIMNEGVLCGVGGQYMVNGKIQRPLYACTVTAIAHAENMIKQKECISTDVLEE